ncbi:hypothetical protein GCM10022248_50150 [Nonomuraea soli]
MAVALIGAFVGVPAPAQAASPIETEISVLKEELNRVIEVQQQGPAPMDDQVAASMKKSVEKAQSAEPCESADGLLSFAQLAREQVRVLQEVIGKGGWNADQLAQLNAARNGLDKLGRQAGAIRARVFTELKECEGPLDFYVDPDRAKPPMDKLPDDRPLASLTGSDGTPMDFVADELVVTTSNQSELDAVVARWNGKVVNKVEQGDLNHYLVKIETSAARPDQLSDALKALNPDKSKAESVAVSSREGLELLAAAATTEKAAVNWVSKDDDIPNGSTPEAQQGPPGHSSGSYNRNSFSWRYLQSGSTQDIGVPAAWQLLGSVGKLNNKVKMAVLDRAFTTSVDHPSSTTFTTSVPGVSPSFQFPGSTPWHGVKILDSMAAVPGNSVGTAGTAGPVARPTGIWTTGDFFYMMVALGQAAAGGNKIVSISQRTEVPWFLSWSVLPFDRFTAWITNINNILIFASAGNEGNDVDATTGVFVKWEKTWHTPCENAGVICVGGLAHNSLNRHANSNYGSEDVNIYAPYTVLAGPNPDSPNPNVATEIHGTSYATPYTAGVAALLISADPAQNIDTIENILLDTMRLSPDGKVKRKVVHALGAVQEALPPTVKINTPLNGETLSAHIPASFTASVFGDGNGQPTITWRRGGVVIGTGPQIQATVPAGTHTITATAAFTNGVTAVDQVTATWADHVPDVKVTGPKSPTTTPTFDQSELIPFHSTSLDDLGPLAESSMKWYLDNATTPFATGHNPTVNTGAAVGAHTVTLKGCDPVNQCDQETIPIAIQPDGANKPPVVKVTSPANGALLWVNGNDATGWYHELTLNGTATDPEGNPVTVKWFDNGVQISDTLQPTVRLKGGCGSSTHNLTLRATDNAGISRQDQVTVTVSLIC